MVRHFATDDDTIVALPSPYLGVLKFGKDGRRGYQIPKCGNLQLVRFRKSFIWVLKILVLRNFKNSVRN